MDLSVVNGVVPLGDCCELEIENLLMGFSKEYNAEYDADLNSVSNVIECVCKNGIGFGFVKNEELVGIIGGVFYPNPFNKKVKMLGELFWYVRKEYRKGMVGGRLLVKYMEAAEESDAQGVVLSLLDTTEGIEDNLVRNGFTMKEKNFIKWRGC